jgi:hypothetical protein
MNNSKVDTNQNNDYSEKISLYMAELNYLFTNLEARLNHSGNADLNKENERLNRVYANIIKIPGYEKNSELRNSFLRYSNLIKVYEESFKYRDRINNINNKLEFLTRYIVNYDNMNPTNKLNFENECKEVIRILSEIAKEISLKSNNVLKNLTDKRFKEAYLNSSKIRNFLISRNLI